MTASSRATRAKHTPGPWHWYWRIDDRLRADCGVFHEIREGQVQSICRAPQYESERQWEANARLIAAAPDLLAALIAVVSVADRKTDEFDLAHAAIAKATQPQKSGLP